MHWLTKVFDFLPPHQWWFIHSISTLVVHWKIWTSCKTSFKKLAHYPPGQLEDWLAALQWSTGLHSCEPDWICHSLDQQPAVEDHFALAVEGPTKTISRHLIVVVNSFHSYLAHTVTLISIRFYGPHLSTSYLSYRTWTRGQCHCKLVLPPLRWNQMRVLILQRQMCMHILQFIASMQEYLPKIALNNAVARI